jgi:predicted Na+-dependent transporter
MKTAILCIFFLVATSARAADQPSSTATAAEHYVFMENLAVFITCAVFLIIGLISGYGFGRERTGGGD